MIKAVFLDFDGTISDAKNLTFNTMHEVLTEKGLKIDNEKLRKLMGDKMHIIFSKLKIKEDINKMRKLYYKQLLKNLKTKKLMKCVSLAPLKKLKRKHKIIILSNSETKFLKASVKKLKIKKLFSKIIGAEKFLSKDVALKFLFKKMNLSPKEAVYIGDRFSDIRFARSAGCWAVAIQNPCSWSTLDEIIKEKPDFIIKDFTDLERVIEKINSQNN